MANVTLNLLYEQLVSLRKEVEEIRFAILPEAKVSKAQLKRLEKIENEMKSGKYTKASNYF
ncbi:MAG: hypothetical protein AABY04_03065 [Candidatus Micrarchaeota archaeon]